MGYTKQSSRLRLFLETVRQNFVTILVTIIQFVVKIIASAITCITRSERNIVCVCAGSEVETIHTHTHRPQGSAPTHWHNNTVRYEEQEQLVHMKPLSSL